MSGTMPTTLPIQVAVPAPKQPSIMLYGLVILLLGLAVLFLINRVKAIDQRQRMLETQQQRQLTEDDVLDIAHAYLTNPTNSDSLKRFLAPHVEAALDGVVAASDNSCCAPAASASAPAPAPPAIVASPAPSAPPVTVSPPSAPAPAPTSNSVAAPSAVVAVAETP